jgi:terminase, large subunit
MTPVSSIQFPVSSIQFPVSSPPPWFAGIADIPRRITGVFSDAERRILRKRQKIRVSAWAERHRVITMGKYQGSWQNTVNPHLVGIMDAIAYRSVRVVDVCAPPQTGKSESVNTFIGWVIDRDPGPVLYVYPDRNTAVENSKDRILPMIEGSFRLREYLTGMEDDKTSLRIKLTHMPIYVAWAGSAARLANKPIKYVVFDETDKYPPFPNKREADPISLGEKRVITYKYDHKIIKLSTPTIENAPIWRALYGYAADDVAPEVEEVFQYAAPCHACGEYQVMEFEQIQWPKDRDAKGQEINPPADRMEKECLARYVCIHCQAEWADADRDRALQRGRWVGQASGLDLDAYLTQVKPRKIGFHYASWMTQFTSLSTVAAAFLRAKHNPGLLKDFRNAHQAIPWLDYTQERQEDAILALRDERPRGLVPSEGVIGITAAVDTQDYGFWYEVRAWGSPDFFESWQVREGYVPSDHKGDFAALEKVLFEDAYYDAAGTAYPIQLVFIDSGGHRTWEVYQWCRSHGRMVIPIKGEGRMTGTHAWSKQDLIPGTNKPIPGGIQILRLNVNLYKDQLAGRLEIAPADPGAWHLHSETPMSWAAQMCAEFVNDKGVWECPNGKDNHAWDCSCYNWAAADIFVRHWRRKVQGSEVGGQRSEKPDAKPFIPRPGKWLNR